MEKKKIPLKRKPAIPLPLKYTHEEGRSSVSGRFVTDAEVKRNPSNTTREHVPNPGRGDVNPKPFNLSDLLGIKPKRKSKRP